MSLVGRLGEEVRHRAWERGTVSPPRRANLSLGEGVRHPLGREPDPAKGDSRRREVGGIHWGFVATARMRPPPRAGKLRPPPRAGKPSCGG